MVKRGSDGGQPPFGGRLTRAAVAVGIAAALLVGAQAHGTRSSEAAATTAHTRSAAASAYELDGTKGPLRWPACHAIAYRINRAGMPSGMDVVVQRVMAGIARQTGVAFRYAGTTTRTFGSTAKPSTPTIFIGFTPKREAYHHTFAYPGEIGVGGPVGAWSSDGDGHRYEAITSGRVLLSTRFTGSRTGAGTSWPSLIRHEVGHALNLAHRSSATAVMNPSLTGSAPDRFQPAEVAALKRTLQRTGCDDGAWKRL